MFARCQHSAAGLVSRASVPRWGGGSHGRRDVRAAGGGDVGRAAPGGRTRQPRLHPAGHSLRPAGRSDIIINIITGDVVAQLVER